MKNKTMRQVVSQLQAEGHSVTYYIRKDGGILIRSIDGTKFFGASGNLVARQMTGVTLSEKKSHQLTRITKARTTGDTAVDKALRKLQREWKKSFPYKKGEMPAVGKKTLRTTKYYLAKYGKEATLRRLSESLRYAKGIAYTDNVLGLVAQIRQEARRFNSEELFEVADLIEMNIDNILEKNIAPSYECLYNMENGLMEPSECATTLRLLHNL